MRLLSAGVLALLFLPQAAQAVNRGCVPVAVETTLPQAEANALPTAGCFNVVRVPVRMRGASAQVLVFGDPQVKSAADVDYYQRDIVEPLIGMPAALGIVLGDLVDDAPALFPAVKAGTRRIAIPWLFAPGNHDVDADARSDADSLTRFQRDIGADTQARETALANIVVLDDVIVQPGQQPAYIGGLREDQFAFLERWLPTLSKDKLLVVAMHIPLFRRDSADSYRAQDRTRLYALLAPFPHVLVLSAHTHVQQQYAHTARDGWHGPKPLHEYNVGAACGAFWSGVRDAAGIPAATMADGTPNGYAVLTVKMGGAYALAWHNARDPDDIQIGLHAPKVLRRGAYPAWGVYANVYMGDADTRVEYRIDDGAWKPMRSVLQPDPALLAENVRDDEADALRGYDRSPEAKASPHLWRGALPTDLAEGEHVIEVRAFDRWRGEVRAQTVYRLMNAQP